MIEKITINNFKSLREIDNLEIAPITVLCGTNSCGKSSFLESILFLKQNNEVVKQGILFNGDYTKLGNFSNVVYNHDTENNVIYYEVTFNCHGGTKMAPLIALVTRNEKMIDCSNAKIKISVQLSELESAESDFRSVDTQIDSYHFELVYDDDKSDFSLEKKDDGYVLSYHITAPTVVEEYYPQSAMSQYLYQKNRKYTKAKLKIKRTGLLIRGSHTFKGYLPDADEIYDSLYTLRFDDVIGGPKKLEEYTKVRQFIYTSNSVVSSLFGAISYIGPLREAPARRYIYDNTPLGIGNKGENAAYILETEQDHITDITFSFDTETQKFVMMPNMKLKDAVDLWMSFMGIKSFSTKQDNDVIRVSLKDINTGATDVNIADVGFGISQVFPMVLEGLRIGSGSALILEQPEIHLHPKLQMQIADFLIAMALSKRQLIVETHSDHLVNRLIRRVVEDDSGQLSDLIRVYFVTPSSGGACFTPVEIDECQGIVNWPEGFFDQSATEQEQIIKAGLAKRKRRREAEKR